jgi:hypothetical protein
MQKTLAYLAVVLVFVLGALAGAWLRGLRPGQPAQPVKPDTVYVDTTIYVDKPVPVEVTPKGYELVPVGTIDRINKQVLALEDSLDKKPKIVVKDSLIYIDVPMEQKHYGDSTYDAWVSGYRPALDSLRIHQRTAIIKDPVSKTATKTKHWSVTVGPQVGYGFTPKGWQPYAGVGITAGYTF